MSTQLTIAHSAVNAKLVNPTKEQKLMVQQLLSYKVEGFEHMNYGAGTWDGRSSFFDFATATFPAGFVTKVQSAFIKAGHKVNVVRRPFPEPLGPVNPKVDSFPEDPRYEYQPRVVETLLRRGQMIARVATGGGKSRIAKLVHCRIGRPTLFLTTRGILMHQMRNAFMEDLGAKVGIYGDDEWSLRPEQFNVGMVQTFAARLANKTLEDEFTALAVSRERKVDKVVSQFRKKLKTEGASEAVQDVQCAEMRTSLMKLEATDVELASQAKVKLDAHEVRKAETIKLLQHFELVIGEEAHEVSSDSFFRIMRECVNAHYRLALTATPFMKDAEEANMRLEACFGPIGITISEKDLIDLGILAKPYFQFIRLADPTPVGLVEDARHTPPKLHEVKLMRSTPYARAYEVGISCGIKRNQAICDQVMKATQHGLTSMVLVQHKVHGTRLAEMLTARGIKCAFIQGENDQKERTAAITALKSGQITCLIGSTILDVGVDVPAVGLVVLAGAGKAEVAVRQRIGRGLRAKKSGPNVCFIIDFDDWVNNNLREHSRERRQMIEGTPGFVEGISPTLPWHLFEQVDA